MYVHIKYANSNIICCIRKYISHTFSYNKCVQFYSHDISQLDYFTTFNSENYFFFFCYSQATVTVGDVICFLMPEKEDASVWLSDNSKTLSVNSSSGFGVAMEPSDVLVTYTNNKFTTSTSITILPVKTVCNFQFYRFICIFLTLIIEMGIF